MRDPESLIIQLNVLLEFDVKKKNSYLVKGICVKLDGDHGGPINGVMNFVNLMHFNLFITDIKPASRYIISGRNNYFNLTC